MKILLVDYRNDYYSRSWEKTNRNGTANYYLEYQPLKRLAEANGHSVEFFWIDEAILEHGRDPARKMLIDHILREKPEVCIFHGAEYDIGIETLRALKEKSNSKLVYMCVDDSWSWDRISRHFAPFFSWIVTYCGDAPARYREIGCQNVIHSQPGVDLSTYKKTNTAKDINVSFVGTWSKLRGETISYLRDKNISVLTRGNGWPEGAVTQEEMIDIINRSKISLSLNPPAFYFGWRPIIRLFIRRAFLGEGGLPYKLDIHNFRDNFASWMQKKILQVKARNFEIPACGTAEITQDADDLRDYYKPGEEIIFYRDNKDLAEKINYYLEHNEEREKIAQRGYERTIKDHYAEKRFKEIFSSIGAPLEKK